MSKIEIEVKLSDEDRKLMNMIATAAKAVAGKGKAKAEAEDDTADDTDPSPGEASGDEDDFGGDDDTAEAPTKADVQAALRDYAAVSSKADAIKLMKDKGGSDALSKLKESKFAAVIDAAKAATKKAKK